MNDYCLVYVDYKPDGMPFYVGMGLPVRTKISKRNKWHTNISNKYPGWYRTLAFGGSRESCEAKEIELIAKYGRKDLGTGILVNLTDGGGGTSGYSHSIETKQKIKFARANQKNTPGVKKGYKISDEHRQALSLARIGNKNSVGRVQSAETRAKIAESVRLACQRRKAQP